MGLSSIYVLTLIISAKLTKNKFAKIALRMGYLGPCYCYTKFQKFNGMCVSPLKKYWDVDF